MELAEFRYAAAPLLAWFAAGSLKFAINSLRARRPAFDLIGYGGLPSSHAAIVAAPLALVALGPGIDHPAFGLGVALAMIVLMDARSLRSAVGAQAAALNALRAADAPRFRERMGHRLHELAAGLAVGVAVGWTLHRALG